MEAWTRYWQADRLQSCIPAVSTSEQEIVEHWARFGRSLPAQSRLIDLATGNGAVPAALVKAGINLVITAVDRADIDPPRYLAQGASLRSVEFIGNVDLADPTALEGQYDAVTSQFGIEYMAEDLRAGLLARLLRPGGRFQLLLHHDDSAVVQPRHRDLEELGRLFRPGGLMDALQAFSRRALGGDELESQRGSYLSLPGTKTRRLSGDVLAAIDHILGIHRTGRAECFAMAADLHDRVLAERERLEQLIAAAQDEAAIHTFANQLRAHHLAVAACESLHVSAGDGARALLGWHVAGQAA